MANVGRELSRVIKKLRTNRSRKQRSPRPSISGRKLTYQDVRNIRSRYESGFYTQADLAREFGVSASTINKVVHQETWKQVR